MSSPRRNYSFKPVAFLPLVLGVCAGFALCAWLSRQPAYGGKSLNVWLEDFDSSATFAREQAAEAVRGMGVQALPLLLEHLESSDSSIKLKLVSCLQKQPLVKLHFSPALRRQRLAIRACRALGPVARPAIPKLIPFLNGPLAYEAAYCLAVIDPAGIFPLSRARTSSETDQAIASSAKLSI